MVGEEGKILKICHSRLPENALLSTRTAKNVPLKIRQQRQILLINLMIFRRLGTELTLSRKYIT